MTTTWSHLPPTTRHFLYPRLQRRMAALWRWGLFSSHIIVGQSPNCIQLAAAWPLKKREFVNNSWQEILIWLRRHSNDKHLFGFGTVSLLGFVFACWGWSAVQPCWAPSTNFSSCYKPVEPRACLPSTAWKYRLTSHLAFFDICLGTQPQTQNNTETMQHAERAETTRSHTHKSYHIPMTTHVGKHTHALVLLFL